MRVDRRADFFNSLLGKLREGRATTEECTGTLPSSLGLFHVDVLLEGAPVAEVIRVVERFASSIDDYLSRATESLVSEFLPIHNGGYLYEGDPPLTGAQFVGLAGKPDLSVDADGEVYLTYSHEKLLWGHAMSVFIHPDGTVDTQTFG